MYKIFFVLFFIASLNAEIIDGVGIVVEEKVITFYDIKKEMNDSKINVKRASDLLIRKKLEEIEVKKKNINVSSSEVYEEIKKIASKNNLTVSKYYDVVRNQSGLNSTEFKEKIKQQILSQKLYSSVTYSSLLRPSNNEIEEYYKLHKENFISPSEFEVIIYKSKNKMLLNQKITNIMFNSTDILTDEQTLVYDKISPQIASLLAKTDLNSFSPIISNNDNEYLTFYVKNKLNIKEKKIKEVENTIINIILSQKRERVLNDYFARLRHNANIKMIRIPK